MANCANIVDDDYWGPISEGRRNVWKYYRYCGLAEDGYPLSKSNLIDDKIVAHPIHGCYLIVEYLNSYYSSRNKPDVICRAIKLAKACVSRMAHIGKTLRFLYTQGDGITPYGFTFYSALTQAHYLVAFARLYELTKDEAIKEWCTGIFESLLVPVEDGGVLLRNSLVVTLEEYPTEVPSYVLNGWLTVLNELFEYGYVLQNKKAISLARESAKTLIDLLPIYDAAEVWNTRYKLSGTVLNRLLFKGCVPTLKSITISTGKAIFSKSKFGTSAYDTVGVIKQPTKEDNVLAFRAALTMIDYPNSSYIEVELESEGDFEASWSVGVPQFNPKYYTPKAVSQRRISVMQGSAGISNFRIDIPLDLVVAWTGVPVPFSKKIGDHYYNAYHYIHIKALTQLYEFFPAGKIIHWRDRWLGYVKHWPSFPLYSDPEISYTVIDYGRYSSAEEFLCTPKLILDKNSLVRTAHENPLIDAEVI